MFLSTISRALLASLFVGLSATPSIAQNGGLVTGSVTVRFEDGVQQTTTGPLVGVGTTGDLMAGMSVIARFADGSSQQIEWLATGLGAGAAKGTGWRRRIAAVLCGGGGGGGGGGWWCRRATARRTPAPREWPACRRCRRGCRRHRRCRYRSCCLLQSRRRDSLLRLMGRRHI